MPFVTIRLIGEEEAPSKEEKAEIIREITELLCAKLGKNPATTHVVIEEISPDNWGVGGITTTERRKTALQDKKV